MIGGYLPITDRISMSVSVATGYREREKNQITIGNTTTFYDKKTNCYIGSGKIVIGTVNYRVSDSLMVSVSPALVSVSATCPLCPLYGY